MNAAEAILAEVAAELSWLTPGPVFIGGTTIGLFLDELGRDQLRPTKDVDCIAPSVVTPLTWFALERDLQHRGWSPDRDGPICRYRSPRGHVVDLLGARAEAQGFSATWLEAAAAHTQKHVLGGTTVVATPAVEYIVACKIEAFCDRGAADPLASNDFEDLVALLDGCASLESAIAGAEQDVRAFTVGWFRALRADGELMSAADGHLPRGGDFEGRRRRLRERLQRLAALALR